jgi:hypothetical protein
VVRKHVSKGAAGRFGLNAYSAQGPGRLRPHCIVGIFGQQAEQLGYDGRGTRPNIAESFGGLSPHGCVSSLSSTAVERFIKDRNSCVDSLWSAVPLGFAILGQAADPDSAVGRITIAYRGQVSTKLLHINFHLLAPG